MKKIKVHLTDGSCIPFQWDLDALLQQLDIKDKFILIDNQLINKDHIINITIL